MRRFTRYCSNMPINIRMLNNKQQRNLRTHRLSQLENISHGGICCKVNEYIDIGIRLSISIPSIEKDYEGHGTTAWCRQHQVSGYELGILFDNANEAFSYRMVEQICHIESYRQYVLATEQRSLSSEEAAEEWIIKYAEGFPPPSN